MLTFERGIAVVEHRQRIFGVTLRGCRLGERIVRCRRLRFCTVAGDAVGDGKLLHQAIPDLRWHGGRLGFPTGCGTRRFRLLRRRRSHGRTRLLVQAGRHAAHGLGIVDQLGHFDTVVINTENVAILQLNLTPSLQRNVI